MIFHQNYFHPNVALAIAVISAIAAIFMRVRLGWRLLIAASGALFVTAIEVAHLFDAAGVVWVLVLGLAIALLPGWAASRRHL